MSVNSTIRNVVLAMLLAVLPISVIACPCSDPTVESTDEEVPPTPNGNN